MGNTNTSVAEVRANSNRIRVVTPLTPSAVSFEDDGKFKVGEEALDRVLSNEGNVIQDCQMLIGAPFGVIRNSKIFKDYKEKHQEITL